MAQEIISLKRQELDKRSSLLNDILKDQSYRYTPYSMFAWLELSAEWNSVQFEKIAQQNGVIVIASDKFTVSNVTLPNYIRISLTGASSTSEFEKGLHILSKILHHELDNVIRIL